MAPKEEPKPTQTSGPLAVAAFFINTFSTVKRQREPPTEEKTSHVRLITIVASHFCEKARWILDQLENDTDNPYYFTEDGHPPGFHADFSMRASGNKASVTPMVVLEEDNQKQVTWGSDQLLRKLMPSLYPEEISKEVEEVEVDMAERIGVTLRCIAYHHMLSDTKTYGKSVTKLAAHEKHVSSVESTLFDKMLDKGLGDGILKSMSITADSADASEKTLRQAVDEYSARLADSGGEYFMDTKEKSYGFTAADLTLSGLLYPFVRPKEMKEFTLTDDEMPPAVVGICKYVAESKAGEHVTNMYKKHRPVNEQGYVEMKSVNRNKYPWQF